jgi:hypothetical protein
MLRRHLGAELYLAFPRRLSLWIFYGLHAFCQSGSVKSAAQMHFRAGEAQGGSVVVSARCLRPRATATCVLH